jgi:four helix bundle protein
MPAIKKFEDIEAWQEARILVLSIYAVTNNGDFAKDFGLRDQIRRAVLSIMSNIAEGFERGGPKEFARFLVIAKASAAEVRSQLYVAKDLKYIEESMFETLQSSVIIISKKLSNLIKYIQGDRL